VARDDAQSAGEVATTVSRGVVGRNGVVARAECDAPGALLRRWERRSDPWAAKLRARDERLLTHSVRGAAGAPPEGARRATGLTSREPPPSAGRASLAELAMGGEGAGAPHRPRTDVDRTTTPIASATSASVAPWRSAPRSRDAPSHCLEAPIASATSSLTLPGSCPVGHHRASHGRAGVDNAGQAGRLAGLVDATGNHRMAGSRSVPISLTAPGG
jgi:hypothetical protein